MKKNNQEAEIKKIKSAQSFGVQINTMKKSDGETTYTRSIK